MSQTLPLCYLGLSLCYLSSLHLAPLSPTLCPPTPYPHNCACLPATYSPSIWSHTLEWPWSAPGCRSRGDSSDSGHSHVPSPSPDQQGKKLQSFQLSWGWNPDRSQNLMVSLGHRGTWCRLSPMLPLYSSHVPHLLPQPWVLFFPAP